MVKVTLPAALVVPVASASAKLPLDGYNLTVAPETGNPPAESTVITAVQLVVCF